MIARLLALASRQRRWLVLAAVVALACLGFTALHLILADVARW